MIDPGTVWLKINYFRLTHVDDLRKWWVIVLLSVDVFLLVFCLTNGVLYVLGTSTTQKIILAMTTETVNYGEVRAKSAPQTLQIISTSLISEGNETYDVVAQIKNPNLGWAVNSLSYTFTVNDTETDTQTDFIMPNSEKYLMIFGMKGPATATNARATLNLKDITWQRVPDTTKISLSRFEITSPTLGQINSLGIKKIQQVSAEVKNISFESFWQTKFDIVLWQGSTIVGASVVHFNPFRSNEQKTLATQVTIAGSPNKVVIVPDINYLDSTNIIN